MKDKDGLAEVLLVAILLTLLGWWHVLGYIIMFCVAVWLVLLIAGWIKEEWNK